METIKNRLNNLKEEILTQIKDIVVDKFNGEWKVTELSPIRRNVYDSTLDCSSLWELSKLYILRNEVVATFRFVDDYNDYDDLKIEENQEEWFLKYEKIEDLINLLEHLKQ